MIAELQPHELLKRIVALEQKAAAAASNDSGPAAPDPAAIYTDVAALNAETAAWSTLDPLPAEPAPAPKRKPRGKKTIGTAPTLAPSEAVN